MLLKWSVFKRCGLLERSVGKLLFQFNRSLIILNRMSDLYTASRLKLAL